MTETQTKRSNGATLQAQSNFSAIHQHLQALNSRLIDLLGDDYAINLYKPNDFTVGNETFIRFETRCIYFTHNKDHYDYNPSGWIGVSPKGTLISGCWVCGRKQFVFKNDDKEYQPATTLLTLSRNDKRLLTTLLVVGCKELPTVKDKENPPEVAFPVVYGDGTTGFHYRRFLTGKNKWRHMQNGRASEAVFGLHIPIIKQFIQAGRFVTVTESPLDAATLFTAGYPAIAVLGKGNAGALSFDFHRETLLSLLGDAGTIFVWHEPDAEGFAQKVANALQRSVKVIFPPEGLEKDAYRVWLAQNKDWNALRATVRDLLESAVEVAPQPVPVSEPKIVGVRRHIEAVWRPLGEITMPQNDRWQVEGLIKEGNLVILSARPKTAKSIVALNLAACVAMGKPFLDRSVTQGRALFVAYERFDLTLQRARAMGLADCYDFMLWDKYAWGLPRIEALDFWFEFIERHGVRLFVVDTLAHFLRPELEKVRNAINAYDFVYKVMERLQAGVSDTGCTIVLIHHDRKGETAETDEARVLGTTALTAAADAVFQLKLMSDKVVCLKATGNAIEDTTLYFTVGEDFWLELADKPATTKEERAARAIEDYLRQHSEATRQRLIDLVLEIGLAENKTTASKLVDRAIQDRLVTKIRKEYRGRELVYHWQGGRATSPAPHSDSDPQDSPDRAINPQGELKTTTTDMEFVYGVYRQEATVDTVDIVDIVDNGRHVYGVYNSTDPLRRLTPKTNLIGVCNVYNPDSPEGDPPEDQTRPEGDLQGNPPANDPLYEEELWGWFTPERLKPSARADQRERPEPTENPTEPDRPKPDSDPQGYPCAQAQSEGSPPDEPAPSAIKRVESDCVVVATADWVGNDGVVVVTSDEIPPDQPEPEVETPLLCPDLPASEPDQPDATLTEPICPYCGEILEPDPETELAACLGCGRVFKVETPPDSPDDDENPPESPDGDDGNPPQPPNNGYNSSQTGFAPPQTLSIPPAFSPGNLIYLNKSTSPAILNRMTERLPDGSIKLEWVDSKGRQKTEIVAPDDLAGWQPIEEIPEISLPSIESVEIPPVVVLDIETTDLNPKRGRILAVGLALYVEGKEVETQIIRNEGNEAALLAQVFDWLRETYDSLGKFILTGYNVFDFDLPYLIERAHKLRVKCPFRFKEDDDGEIKRWPVAATEGTLKGEPLYYPGIVVDRDLPISIVDTLHLVCRWDYTAKELRNYDLKSVAAHFGVNKPDRPVLSPDEIIHAFYHDPKTFEAYLLADLRETYAVFAKLIPPYAAIAAITELPLNQVVTRSTAWIWQQILERYYDEIPQPDEKRKYEGGLVVSRKGLWSPCLKLDIASLYPTIMLAYRIHSRKDPAQYALRWLKTLTLQRLALKAKAKAGDKNAQILQEAMKILLNSLYGFYGTGGYGFNDMTAASKVTEIGRKVLTCMIAAIEDKGGIVVEADTDGIIVCYRNADPQQILQAVNAAIPPVFKVEVEWQEAVCFVSDDKSYIVLPKEGDPIIKGSKWRGRDKEAYLTQAIPTFVRLWATQGKEAALAYALEVLFEIRSGQGWRWVARTHRVGKGDKFLVEAGFKVGEIATYAYKDRKRKIVAKNETEGYDCDYYAKQFSDTVKEVIEVIDPAQIAAWREMVAAETRPLIFAGIRL
jgi:DNA polymerase III epsilon subunit-like protein/predicted  nucleic acid-binding Zn-ribbon protein